jgi:hypothetical protein
MEKWRVMDSLILFWFSCSNQAVLASFQRWMQALFLHLYAFLHLCAIFALMRFFHTYALLRSLARSKKERKSGNKKEHKKAKAASAK